MQNPAQLSSQAQSFPSPVTGGPTRSFARLRPDIIVARYAEAGVNVADYFEGLDVVEIRECLDTGYRFYWPPSVAGESSFYERLYDPAQDSFNDPDYRKWGEDYQYAFDRIVPGEELLDMGCGYGYFLERAAGVCKASGLDGNSHAVERCRSRGLTVELGSIQDYATRWKERFDTVCAFQVLEHIYDVRSFVEAVKTVVKPSGRIIFAVPNNEPFIRRFDAYHTWNLPPHHVGLWDLGSLRKMATALGMRLEHHAYSEASGRWVVEAYLHARQKLGITTEIHQHSLAEKARIAALAPFLAPASLLRHWREKGLGTRNVVAVELRLGA